MGPTNLQAKLNPNYRFIVRLALCHKYITYKTFKVFNISFCLGRFGRIFHGSHGSDELIHPSNETRNVQWTEQSGERCRAQVSDGSSKRFVLLA